MPKEPNLKKSLQVLKKKFLTLKRNLKNKRFMASIPVEIISVEFEQLADEALALSFSSKTYSNEFYDLHEELNLLSRDPTQCAA